MPLRPPENFATAHLRGRPVAVADAPALFAAYAGDPAVTRYLSWKAHADVASLAAFLQTMEAVWSGESTGQFAWALELALAPGTPVGSIGVGFEPGKALVGYVLTPRLWGRGLMSEALTWLVQWCLEQPGIQRAWAYCDTENPASARVMEKAGMQREGLLRRWHVCPTIGPELRDCLVYAKTK